MTACAVEGVVSLRLEALAENPRRTNRMGASAYRKMREHIRRTGLYEPLIVRPAGNGYQIINGHHRVNALRELGYEQALCAVWLVDDVETDIMLGTLNRLRGNDDLHHRRELVSRLAKNYDVPLLSRMLSGGRREIEALVAAPSSRRPPAPCQLNPVTFFLTDAQKLSLDKAISQAAESYQGTLAQKKAAAIAVVAQKYAEKTRENT